MKIALIGYGKMGKSIHQIAERNGDEICFIVDREDYEQISNIGSSGADVAIEFSNPESAFENIVTCISHGIPVVSGTTGWLDRYQEAVDHCEENNGSFMYASNYSIGVNIFFELNSYLAKRMSKYHEYKASMQEIHHTEKLDAPSGTAITLAECLMRNHDSYQRWENEVSLEKGVLGIESLREGKVPGTHIIKYTSDLDEITIGHEAHGRIGFAKGAYDAARWLKDRKGVYDIKDMLFSE